jgi:hypothetical protein
MPLGSWECLARVFWNKYVPKLSLNIEIVDRPLDPEILTPYDLDLAPFCSFDYWHIACAQITIARGAHLVFGREICPQLKAIHPTLGVWLWHLLMDDSASGRHPLYLTSMYGAAVSKAITVLGRTLQHVGNRLDPPVWMPGKTRQVLTGIVISKIVQHQKRIVIWFLMVTKDPLQVNSCPFEGRLCGFNDLRLSQHNLTSMLILNVNMREQLSSRNLQQK